LGEDEEYVGAQLRHGGIEGSFHVRYGLRSCSRRCSHADADALSGYPIGFMFTYDLVMAESDQILDRDRAERHGFQGASDVYVDVVYAYILTHCPLPVHDRVSQYET
jgi:hypothetical protein